MLFDLFPPIFTFMFFARIPTYNYSGTNRINMTARPQTYEFVLTVLTIIRNVTDKKLRQGSRTCPAGPQPIYFRISVLEIKKAEGTPDLSLSAKYIPTAGQYGKFTRL